MRRPLLLSRLPILALVSALATLGACARALPVVHHRAADPNAPFSNAVQAGGLLFLAGKVGTDSTGRLAPGGIRAETRAAMARIVADVERYGSSMDRVVKCNVFLADIAEWGAMSEEYVRFFPRAKPARTALAVGGLPLGARVEIECIAAVR